MHRALKFELSLYALLMLVTASTTFSHAQGASDQLSHVKKLYVDSLGNDRGAAEMRAQMIRKLLRSRDIQVVSDPGKADAVVKGTGRTWLTGRISLSPRSHSLSQPMFDGFLSVEIVNKNDETLWSYLVSPSKFAWNGITADLASQMVSRMLLALKTGGQQESASSTSAKQIEGALQGAGATFPAPLYQRWFELFQESHPNVHVSYDAVGSAEGIERLREGKTDFGASEMALSDQDMSETHKHFQQLPTALGAVVVIYNVKGLRQVLNFTPETLAAIYLGKMIREFSSQTGAQLCRTLQSVWSIAPTEAAQLSYGATTFQESTKSGRLRLVSAQRCVGRSELVPNTTRELPLPSNVHRIRSATLSSFTRFNMSLASAQ